MRLAVVSSILVWLFPVVQSRRPLPTEFFGGTEHDEYLAWLDKRGNSYRQHQFFPCLADETNGASIHWTLDETHISLAVAVRATGWLGFGIAEAGGMEGSDMLLFEAARPQQVRDAHVLDDLIPIDDVCNNWEFVSSTVDGEFMVVEVRRLIDTGDPQDRVFIPDGIITLPLTRVIFAWGDGDTVTYHGLEDRAKGAMRFHAPDDLASFEELMDAEADGFIEIRASDFSVPAEDTFYQDFCFTWDDLLAQGAPSDTFSIIGFLPIADNMAFTHHFTVYGRTETMNGQPCEKFKEHLDMIYGWSPGEPPQAMPDHVALFAGGNSYRSFRLEMHYNNPRMIEGIRDSSGVRLYYSRTLREFEAAIVQIGDPGVVFEDQLIPNGLARYDFHCPSTCTDIMLPERMEVTVIRDFMHMHARGQVLTLEQIRDGEVIHTSKVEFHRFDQQGNHVVQQESYKVRGGDAFRTTCIYEIPDGVETRWGWGAKDEMCIAFMLYYPKRTFLNGLVPWFCSANANFGFRPCLSTVDNTTIDDIPRSFGRALSEGECRPKSTSFADRGASLSWAGSLMMMVGLAHSFVILML